MPLLRIDVQNTDMGFVGRTCHLSSNHQVNLKRVASDFEIGPTSSILVGGGQAHREFHRGCFGEAAAQSAPLRPLDLSLDLRRDVQAISRPGAIEHEADHEGRSDDQPKQNSIHPTDLTPVSPKLLPQSYVLLPVLNPRGGTAAGPTHLVVYAGEPPFDLKQRRPYCLTRPQVSITSATLLEHLSQKPDC